MHECCRALTGPPWHAVEWQSTHEWQLSGVTSHVGCDFARAMHAIPVKAFRCDSTEKWNDGGMPQRAPDLNWSEVTAGKLSFESIFLSHSCKSCIRHAFAKKLSRVVQSPHGVGSRVIVRPRRSWVSQEELPFEQWTVWDTRSQACCPDTGQVSQSWWPAC